MKENQNIFISVFASVSARYYADFFKPQLLIQRNGRFVALYHRIELQSRKPMRSQLL